MEFDPFRKHLVVARDGHEYTGYIELHDSKLHFIVGIYERMGREIIFDKDGKYFSANPPWRPCPLGLSAVVIDPLRLHPVTDPVHSASIPYIVDIAKEINEASTARIRVPFEKINKKF